MIKHILARSARLATLVLVAHTPIQAQQQWTLSRPAAEFSEGFSQLISIRELADGRVIVADSRDNALQAIDLRTGTSRAIGRQGAGPLEWSRPSRLLGVPGDSTVMADNELSRFFFISPDGRPVRTEVVERDRVSGPAGSSIQFGSGLMSSRATDSRGRFYYQPNSFEFGHDGPVRSDSAPIVRYDRATKQTDTIAFVRTPGTRSGISPQRQGGIRISSVAPNPFPSGDDWSVLPDGRVAIVRVTDYRVEIVASRRDRITGGAVQYQPVPVGEKEKEEWRAASSQVNRRMMVNGQPVAAPPIPEPSEWPATKPPFAVGSIWIAPGGRVWVVRSRAAGDDVPVADVFDDRGRHIGTMTMPRGTRLVGFGRESAYLVRTDDDGLQFLQRYALTP